MRYNLILNILGLISKYIAILFIIPILACVFLKEFSQVVPYILSAIVAFILSWLFSINKTSQKEIDNIKKSESLATVVFSWILFGLVCSIPYLFYGLSFTNSIFEAVSGVTTTGATIFQDFSLYPKSLFFFRSLTQWFGGMGIVVLFIAVLPKIAVAGREMFYSEAPTPTQDKATPRIRYTASWLWGIYFALTVVETIILKICGLGTYEAILTSLSTLSSGGFSPVSDSVLGFSNLGVTLCVLAFMYIAGLNYILIYRAMKNKKITHFFKSEEFIWYFIITCIIAFTLAISLFLNSHKPIFDSFLCSFFEVISTMTSTGFAIDNYITWDATSKTILFIAFFTGGCAMSTSGGIKIVRWIFLGKYLKRELNKIIHPQGVYPIKLDKSCIANDVISQLLAFLAFYFVIFALGAFVILLIENNTTVALSVSATSIGNIGPAFGIVGPFDNYDVLANSTKWISVLLMLIGRLEIIPFLAILNKDMWKN